VGLFEIVGDATDSLKMETRDASPAMRVPLQVDPLDDLLGGGVESGAVTQFYGEAGSGKTNVCLQLARNVARVGDKAVYIDTEGVSLERLEQMCGADYEKVQERLLLFEPYDAEEQGSIIDKTIRIADGSGEVGIVLLDSATLFYRLSLGEGDAQRDRRTLTRQLHDLHGLARRRDIPVVITNQVYTDVETDELRPLGGQLLRHLAKAVVRLEKAEPPGLRRANIRKHRSLPEGQTARFRIDTEGLTTP
jgi:DNA repair protein RadB